MALLDCDILYLRSIPKSLLAPIDDKLALAEGLWAMADPVKPNAFGVFAGSTQHIVFQYPVDLLDHRNSRFFPWWSLFREEITPLIEYVGSAYGYASGHTARIMLEKLLPGKCIRPHVDKSGSARIPHKIHMPLSTHTDAILIVNGNGYHLERGGSYAVNNQVVHSAENQSPRERVHLIFDYYNRDVH